MSKVDQVFWANYRRSVVEADTMVRIAGTDCVGVTLRDALASESPYTAGLWTEVRFADGFVAWQRVDSLVLS